MEDVFDTLKDYKVYAGDPIPWGGGLPGEYNAFYGKKHTEETKKILSEKFTGKNLGNKHMGDVSGKNNPMYGKYGIDNPNFGKKRSDDFKKSQSARFSGEGNPMYGRSRETHPSTKFSEEELKQLRLHYIEGMSRSEIYDHYNGKYSLSTIKRAVRKYD